MSTLKELGNAAYKQRDFTSALDLYDQAWQHDKDITCLNNKSGQLLIPPHSHPPHSATDENHPSRLLRNGGLPKFNHHSSTSSRPR